MGRQVIGQGPTTRPVTGGTPIVHQTAESRPGTSVVMSPVVEKTHWDRCTKNTKAGLPCKMAPVKGTPLCVAHTRQAESNDKSRTPSPVS